MKNIDEIRQIFQDLYKERGNDLFINNERLLIYLSQNFEFPKESKKLEIAVRENIPVKMISEIESKEDIHKVDKYVDKLVDDYGMDIVTASLVNDIFLYTIHGVHYISGLEQNGETEQSKLEREKIEREQLEQQILEEKSEIEKLEALEAERKQLEQESLALAQKDAFDVERLEEEQRLEKQKLEQQILEEQRLEQWAYQSLEEPPLEESELEEILKGPLEGQGLEQPVPVVEPPSLEVPDLEQKGMEQLTLEPQISDQQKLEQQKLARLVFEKQIAALKKKKLNVLRVGKLLRTIPLMLFCLYQVSLLFSDWEYIYTNGGVFWLLIFTNVSLIAFLSAFNSFFALNLKELASSTRISFAFNLILLGVIVCYFLL